MIEVTWPMAVVLVIFIFLVCSTIYGIAQMHYGHYE